MGLNDKVGNYEEDHHEKSHPCEARYDLKGQPGQPPDEPERERD